MLLVENQGSSALILRTYIENNKEREKDEEKEEIKRKKQIITRRKKGGHLVAAAAPLHLRMLLVQHPLENGTTLENTLENSRTF
jgi:DNA gyrase/topoisomerase IV subunit B